MKLIDKLEIAELITPAGAVRKATVDHEVRYRAFGEFRSTEFTFDQ